MSVTHLHAPFTLAYTYDRSLGPVLGAFFGGLRAGRILGARCEDGFVVVPPAEADPRSGRPVVDLVEVGQEGVVTTWTWVANPRPGQPRSEAFAWALIRLDGADSALLHAVVAPESKVRTGLRVRACWHEERRGELGDLRWFEPCDG